MNPANYYDRDDGIYDISEYCDAWLESATLAMRDILLNIPELITIDVL